MAIGTLTTLIGLINATIGGSMLVLPILALDAGYMDWIIGCLLLASVTSYTAYLLVKHLGKAKSIKQLILNHFKGNHTYTTLYNIVIWLSFMSTMIIYFKLFIIQVEGLLNSHLPILPQLIAIFLALWVVLLRKHNLSEVALASGICSIIGFVSYLVWVVKTAPGGDKSLPMHSPNSSTLLLTLLNVYTIHDFMIQVIIENPNRKSYTKIVVWLYLISNLVLMFVCYSTSGLVNRKPGVAHPSTIIDFFEGSEYSGWNLNCLQLIYIAHILSTFPEFLIVSKIRVFQIFQLEHHKDQQMTRGEGLYIIGTIGICYVLVKLNVSFILILNISGALLSYFFSLFIPIAIHLKCLYYDRSSGYISGLNDRNLEIVANGCECDIVYKSYRAMITESMLLVTAAVLGAFYFFSALKDDIVREFNIQ